MNLSASFLLACWHTLLALTCFLPGAAAGQSTAVVVGIARFQHPNVTELGYADQDASAFADFLAEPAGGRLPADRLRLLTNDEATLAAVQSALQWQRSVADSGTTAYLYLATHGDVAAQDLASGGYLLAHDTPPDNYDLLALSVSYLNDHLAALTSRQVRVVLITDACHAGSLAGDAVGGRTLTATHLMQRRGREIRMLSCQPYELAHEGERWGGGRGAFSYYLERGMRGAADENSDRSVDLYELDAYVRARVSEDTDRAQHPLLSGGRMDEALVTLSAERQQQQLKRRSAELTETLEATLLATVTPQAQRDYVRFQRALADGQLVQPSGQSALSFYERLRGQPDLIALRGMLDEQLTVALLDSVQQAILAYLAADPAELSDRDRIDEKYAVFPRYLDEAARILGENDPRHPGILARAQYFRGVVLRLRADRSDAADSSYHRANEYLEAALDLYPEAAYLHNESGLLLMRLGEARQAYERFRRAAVLAPTWALPYSNLGMLYKQRHPERYYNVAAAYYDRALALKPDLSGVYLNYGNLMYETGRLDSAAVMLRQAYALNPGDTYVRYNLALLLAEDTAGAERAQQLFASIVDEDYGLVADALRESGLLYLRMGRPDSALLQLRLAIERSPKPARAYLGLREAYQQSGQHAEARAYFNRLIEREPASAAGYYNLALVDTTSDEWLRGLRRAALSDSLQRAVATELGFLFFRAGQFNQGEASLRFAARGGRGYLAQGFNLTAFLAATGQNDKAIAALRALLKNARAEDRAAEYCERFAADADFTALRKAPAYRQLYQTYCDIPAPAD
ncbi:tetratricopeptide repeat protein [Neolewinella litorea]|uniref:Tetratricopeptide repeat protein n=1 Tax=Neolewinella litorea TaxID=2562452 RepID=A0A4S4NJ38_9BACT|nr:tetratricopeptide repeat protein [Neolewinella litorea]THH39782.1 tetratricopeptide repeat protein [Neolewinella litorea]